MSRSKKQYFCCEALESLISDPDDSPLHYIPYKREFVLTTPRRYLKGPNEVALKFKITHCPRCGEKFPIPLTDKWYELLEAKFGITDYVDQEVLDSLPQEFRTNEWWKKRGL